MILFIITSTLKMFNEMIHSLSHQENKRHTNVSGYFIKTWLWIKELKFCFWFLIKNLICQTDLVNCSEQWIKLRWSNKQSSSFGWKTGSEADNMNRNIKYCV